MSAHEKKLTLIAFLLSFAGGVIYWQFSQKPLAKPPTLSDDGLKLAGEEPPLIHKFSNEWAMDSMGRPLFERAKRVPAPDLPEIAFIQPVPEFPDRPVMPVIPEPPPQPPTPPPPVTPPPTPFQYTGYARDAANGMIAFIETTGTSAPAGHYNLRESDFFLGRFRLNKISTDFVEIEDMERAESSADRKRTIAISAMLASRKSP